MATVTACGDRRRSPQPKVSPWCPTRRPCGIPSPRIAELAKPKPVHPKFIPDKPSVYWLDHLLDPTPHKIKDPEELKGYYRRFSTPRLETLSKPKLSVTSVSSSESSTKPRSATGIPLSALKYVPTERIKQLAEPRPDTVSLRATQSLNFGWPGQTRSRSAGAFPATRQKLRARSRF